MNKYTAEILKRFWEKVEIGTIDECWNWQARCRNGYGQFKINGVLHSAHRVSWEIHNGQFPREMKVCHKCDNPSCVNPSHLFLGTQSDNIRDMIAKGRKAIISGELHCKAKITDKQVLEIRTRHKLGDVTYSHLARIYGVNHSTISRIVLLKTHKNIK